MPVTPCIPPSSLLPLVGLLAAAAPAVAQQEPAPDPPPEAQPEEALLEPDEDLAALEVEPAGIPVSGALWTRVRSRWNDDEEDSDLFATLRMDMGDVERLGYGVHVAATGVVDLDGTEDGEFDFFGVYDTYDRRARLRLNLAYLDIGQPGLADRLRVGRQQIYTAPEFAWFDGFSIEHGDRTQRELVLGGYAGQPVRQFDSSTSGDLLSGTYAEFTPWWSARLRVDFMRFEDQSRIGEGGNDLWNFELSQELLPGVDLSGSYSRLDSHDRDVSLDLISYGLGEDLVLRLSWYELLRPQGFLANELDPFTSSTLSLEPYRQGRLLVSKGLGESVVIEAGADVRRVTDELLVGEFNRDFERYFLRGTLLDALDSGFDVTLTGELWEADTTDLETWGFDLEKELSEDTELSLGSYYSLYKYDLFLDAERDDVRSYHAGLSHDWREDLRVDLDYIYEDDDEDDNNTIRLGVRWSF